jgi:nucleoside-diphosphate-sugar epimerase
MVAAVQCGMNIAVTGAAGRVGRATLAELRTHGHTAWGLDRALPPNGQASRALLVELADAGGVYGALGAMAIEVGSVDAVIHLGAIPNLAHHSAEHVFANNTTACANVAAACRALGIRRVVYSSSVTVYNLAWQARNGGVARLPADESVPHRPNNAYALSKWVGEELFALAGLEWGLCTASLRPSLVIGPDEYATRGRPRDEHAAGGLWGHVDSRDVAQAARLAAEKLGTTDALGPGNHPFNVNAAVAHARRPLADLLPQHFPQLAHLAPSLQGDQAAFGIEKARRLLGYAPRYSWRTELGE